MLIIVLDSERNEKFISFTMIYDFFSSMNNFSIRKLVPILKSSTLTERILNSDSVLSKSCIDFRLSFHNWY